MGREKQATPSELFDAIATKLGTIDGIATADAVALGSMVQEYGNARAGEAGSKIMIPLLDMMMKPPKPPAQPWEATP